MKGKNKNHRQELAELAERDRIIASAALNRAADAEDQRRREEAEAAYLRPARLAAGNQVG